MRRAGGLRAVVVSMAMVAGPTVAATSEAGSSGSSGPKGSGSSSSESRDSGVTAKITVTPTKNRRSVATARATERVLRSPRPSAGRDAEAAVFGAAFAIDAAHAAGDVELAAVALPAVEAFPSRDMVLGYVTSTLGPTARPIALALDLVGRTDDALALPDETIAHYRTQRAELWAVRCELAVRDILRRHGEGEGDGSRRRRAEAMTDALRRHPLLAESPRLAREVG